MNKQKAQKIWNVFQNTVEKYGGDNSMGDYNWLICQYILDQGSYYEEEFKNQIKRYLKQ